PTDAPSAPVAASATEASPAKDALASEPALSEALKAEPVKAEASAAASQPETASGKPSGVAGKVIVMPRGERSWTDHDIHVGPEEPAAHGSGFGQSRIAAIAAMVALAIAAGARG